MYVDASLLPLFLLLAGLSSSGLARRYHACSLRVYAASSDEEGL